MEQEIKGFMSYLHNVKKTSRNTELSYQRDLMKMMHFLQKQKVEEAKEVTETALNSYILDLEKNGMSAATVSRNIASMKGFYLYLWKEGSISSDPAEKLKAPKVEKKLPEIMSVEEMERLLEQPGDRTAKGLRDSAMLELLYATGIRVTELISLKLSDVNWKLDYIVCRDRNKERMIPFGPKAKKALERYLKEARGQLLGDKKCEMLFPNCSGESMSRAGLLEAPEAVCEAGGYRDGDYAPYPSPFLCGALGGERRGSARGTGDAGAFRYFHDHDVRSPGKRDIREGASERII